MDKARFRKQREKNGYTQKSLGDKLGVSSSTVSMWELGDRDPDTEMLRKISDLFNVSADYLLGRVKNPNIAIIEDLPAELKNAGLDALFVMKEALKTGLTPEDIEDALMLAKKMKDKYKR
jgi:transcriptional regulator with XRE-family HTH domain